MSLMEQNSANDCLTHISENLKNICDSRVFGKHTCFVNQKGIPFRLFKFPGREALGVEYADNSDEAAIGRFEDGDLFYLSDFSSEDELQAAMLEEIRNAE